MDFLRLCFGFSEFVSQYLLSRVALMFVNNNVQQPWLVSALNYNPSRVVGIALHISSSRLGGALSAAGQPSFKIVQ
jgi:hypothetical protein